MHSSLFSKLATDSSVSRAQGFSQQSWRRNHYSPSQTTLCSALTYFWLTEKLYSRSPIFQLDEPSKELLQHLARVQSLSYYPAFPDDFKPGERELSLLSKKYGTRDWGKIQRCLANEHQGDCILYDLSRAFRYEYARITCFKNLPTALPCLKSLPARSAVIGVLRYLENGRPSGHRVAYYLDDKKQHHFFDPNAGEIIEPDETRFHQWLNAFLNHASFRSFEPSVDEPFLTLYQLNKVSPQTQEVAV